jgi:hypothetical protein
MSISGLVLGWTRKNLTLGSAKAVLHRRAILVKRRLKALKNKADESFESAPRPIVDDDDDLTHVVSGGDSNLLSALNPHRRCGNFGPSERAGCSGSRFD